jgi:hypothetical protein
VSHPNVVYYSGFIRLFGKLWNPRVDREVIPTTSPQYSSRRLSINTAMTKYVSATTETYAQNRFEKRWGEMRVETFRQGDEHIFS